MRFDTRAVRSGRGAEAPTLSERGEPHVPGIDLSTTYGFRSSAAVAESMDALIDGDFRAPNAVYARLHNPTVAGFEAALADLEGADDGVAFATGMAAITALIMVATAPVDAPRRPHVVAVRPVYGGTDHLLTTGLLGSDVEWVRAEDVGRALRSETGLVFLETPANPTLAMVDIEDVVAQVRRRQASVGHHVPVAVDSTFATPVLQNPIELGADLVVHSATKFLGGHGDAMGGIVATSDRWARPLRQLRMMTGGILHPLAAYLLHRGLQTLPIRVRAQQQSAELLARRLSRHSAVRSVHYPGLNDDPVERRLLRTQQRGPGSVLSFTLHGGSEAARRTVESLRVITRAVSLGSVDSLIQAPALLTHRVVDASDRTEAGVPDDLLRLSVGLEAPEDLWSDLDRALRDCSLGVQPAHRVEPLVSLAL